MADPAPVEVVNVAPLPVAIVAGAPAAPSRPREQTQQQATDPSRPASTTFQQDLVSAGQRNINVMWEGTQKNIAQWVVVVALVVLAFLIVAPGVPTELRLVALSTLSNVLFAVTSVYFTRTNHTKTGGVGVGEVGR